MFLETIRIEHAQPQLLDRHYARMCRSARRAGIPEIPYPAFLSSIGSAVERHVGGNPARFKLRMQYAGEIEAIDVQRYNPRAVTAVVLCTADELEYGSKFSDRGALDRYQELLGPRAIALYVKHGLLTDLWYANVVLRRGGVWYTPAVPLLGGVMREHLLAESRTTDGGRCGGLPVREADIPAADTATFEVLS
ncbi:MAG: aminotransferase class IV, partial [Spirochaetia bacterium]